MTYFGEVISWLTLGGIVGFAIGEGIFQIRRRTVARNRR